MWCISGPSDKRKRSEFKYHFGDNELGTVDKYKYLGIYLDEHITFEHCSRVLSKNLRDVEFGTFGKMYEAGVMSVCNYAA